LRRAKVEELPEEHPCKEPARQVYKEREDTVEGRPRNTKQENESWRRYARTELALMQGETKRQRRGHTALTFQDMAFVRDTKRDMGQMYKV
jgi:hypothetical protein